MTNTGDQGQPEVYTLGELSAKAESEQRDRLVNGLTEGDYRVFFDKSNLTIEIEFKGKNCGQIDLEQCNNSNDLLDLIFDIHGQESGHTGGLLAAILVILNDACEQVHKWDARSLFQPGKTIDWCNPNS